MYFKSVLFLVVILATLVQSAERTFYLGGDLYQFLFEEEIIGAGSGFINESYKWLYDDNFTFSIEFTIDDENPSVVTARGKKYEADNFVFSINGQNIADFGETSYLVHSDIIHTFPTSTRTGSIKYTLDFSVTTFVGEISDVVFAYEHAVYLLDIIYDYDSFDFPALREMPKEGTAVLNIDAYSTFTYRDDHDDNGTIIDKISKTSVIDGMNMPLVDIPVLASETCQVDLSFECSSNDENNRVVSVSYETCCPEFPTADIFIPNGRSNVMYPTTSDIDQITLFRREGENNVLEIPLPNVQDAAEWVSDTTWDRSQNIYCSDGSEATSFINALQSVASPFGGQYDTLAQQYVMAVLNQNRNGFDAPNLQDTKELLETCQPLECGLFQEWECDLLQRSTMYIRNLYRYNYGHMFWDFQDTTYQLEYVCYEGYVPLPSTCEMRHRNSWVLDWKNPNFGSMMMWSGKRDVEDSFDQDKINYMLKDIYTLSPLNNILVADLWNFSPEQNISIANEFVTPNDEITISSDSDYCVTILEETTCSLNGEDLKFNVLQTFKPFEEKEWKINVVRKTEEPLPVDVKFVYYTPNLLNEPARKLDLPNNEDKTNEIRPVIFFVGLGVAFVGLIGLVVVSIIYTKKRSTSVV